MMAHQRNDPFHHPFRHAQPFQKRFRKRRSRFVMSRRDDALAPLFQSRLRGGRFAKVMRQDRHHIAPARLRVRRLPVRQPRQRVASVAGVREDVPFGVPLRFLRDAD